RRRHVRDHRGERRVHRVPRQPGQPRRAVQQPIPGRGGPDRRLPQRSHANTLVQVTVKVLRLDGDDTLWRNEKYFADTQQTFRALLASYVGDDVDLDDRMNATERTNLELFGYGMKGFTLSLIETAIETSGGRIAAADIQQLLELG